jgi:hypothetical protein
VRYASQHLVLRVWWRSCPRSIPALGIDCSAHDHPVPVCLGVCVIAGPAYASVVAWLAFLIALINLMLRTLAKSLISKAEG